MPGDSVFQVVRSGDLCRLKEHLDEKKDQLFVKDRNGQTALHIAATEGRLQEASYLIEGGSFVHVYDTAGRVPFHCAVLNNQVDMATYLLEMGTFPHLNTRSEDTALHLSVGNSLIDMTSWLISIGANLHAKNRDGDTPIHKAAFSGNVTILQQMMKYNPNLEVVNNNGATPFHVAAAWGNLSAVQFLYDSGGNIHHVNYKGDSALHVAAVSGSLSVVKWLLLQGVSLTDENLAGCTAHDVARSVPVKELLSSVCTEGLGVIYNKGKPSVEEMKIQQQEERRVKLLLIEEYKEERNMNARLLLEKELRLLNAEESDNAKKEKKKIVKSKQSKGQTVAGSPNQWATYNGQPVVPSASTQEETLPEDEENEKEENSDDYVLETLIAKQRDKTPRIDVRASLATMIPAPRSYASGVTDTGTTIAGHQSRSEDTLSDDTEVNDLSMLSQTSADYWNERAGYYLRRMHIYSRKVSDSSSSDEESEQANSDTESEHEPERQTKTDAEIEAELLQKVIDSVVDPTLLKTMSSGGDDEEEAADDKDKKIDEAKQEKEDDINKVLEVEMEDEYVRQDEEDELTVQDFRGKDCTQLDSDSDSDRDHDSDSICSGSHTSHPSLSSSGVCDQGDGNNDQQSKHHDENEEDDDEEDDSSAVQLCALDVSMVPLDGGACSDTDKDRDQTGDEESVSIDIDSNVTVEGTFCDDLDSCQEQEKASLQRLIELQTEELEALKAQQQQMLTDLQRSQQDEVNTELTALSMSLESDMDDDDEDKRISKMNDLRDELNKKHRSELRQLWKDHQTTLKAMQETHRFEQMSFSFEYGNEDEQKPKGVTEKKVEDALTEKEQIALLEANITELRNLLRESGVSPSGLQASPSGITSVMEQVLEGEQEDDDDDDDDDDQPCDTAFGNTEADVNATDIRTNDIAVDNNLTPTEGHVKGNELQGQQTEENTQNFLLDSPQPSRRRSRGHGSRLSKSPKRLSGAGGGNRLLASGNLAAGLGASVLASMLGDESESESDSGDESLGGSSSGSVEYDSDDDDEEETAPHKESVSEEKASTEMELQQQLVTTTTAPSSGKHALNTDLALELYTPPPPPQSSSDVPQIENKLTNETDLVGTCLLLKDTPSQEQKENVVQETQGKVAVEVSTNESDTKEDQKGEDANTPFPIVASSKPKRKSRLSSGSSRRESSSSVPTPKSAQQMMATGQLAAGLGNTMIQSFLCNSDSDMSTKEDQSSCNSSLTWRSSEYGSHGDQEEEEEEQGFNGQSSMVDDVEDNVEDKAINKGQDIVKNTLSSSGDTTVTEKAKASYVPSAYEVHTVYEPSQRIKMSAAMPLPSTRPTTAAGIRDETPAGTTRSSGYELEVKYDLDLSPVTLSEDDTSKEAEALALSEKEQIALLEANITELRNLLRESGVSPSGLQASPSGVTSVSENDSQKMLMMSETKKAEDEEDSKVLSERELERVAEESKKVFEMIDLNNDGILTKIELIKGLRRNSLNLPVVLNLPAHIRQEDGSRNEFMSVFHAMDKDHSSDVSLPEFVEFCQGVSARSRAGIPPMLHQHSDDDEDEDCSIGGDRGRECNLLKKEEVKKEDADVVALRAAAGQAMQSTVAMLKRVMEDSDLQSTPGKLIEDTNKAESNLDENQQLLKDEEREKEKEREEEIMRRKFAESRTHSGASLTPRLTPRVLTPKASMAQMGTAVSCDIDLSPYKALAEKFLKLASFLLTESRASSLRDISAQISGKVQNIEDDLEKAKEDEEDDLEWGGAKKISPQELQEAVAALKTTCREMKKEALKVVKGEIQYLEQRVSQVSQICTFLD